MRVGSADPRRPKGDKTGLQRTSATWRARGRPGRVWQHGAAPLVQHPHPSALSAHSQQTVIHEAKHAIIVTSTFDVDEPCRRASASRTHMPKAKKLPATKARQAALGERPRVSLEIVQSHAAELRAEFPKLDDDTLALVVLHVQTDAPIATIAKRLGADRSWAYARLARADVQQFMARLAMASLGAAAIRGLMVQDKLMHSTKDERLKFAIAQALADRAGLGNNSGAPQAVRAEGFSFTFAAAAPKAE